GVERCESSFDELLTIPEQDNWTYTEGKSTCVDEHPSDRVCGEFVRETGFYIKDAYILDLFENNSIRLPRRCNDGDMAKLPYCQITGEYRMELPGYNTMQPYPHMNERCPPLHTKYSRTKSF
ncbi:hypothetical protein A2U01_0003174, partial [Trifolium medium]|nr:hypothetical protein [Trifolium medium]